MALEDTVGGNAEGILDVEELAERIKQGQSEAASPRSLICTLGKADCNRGTRRSNMGTMRAWLEAFPGRKRAASRHPGVALENQHGMIHVLAVSAVEEAELLLSVSRIVGGIDVEQNLAALTVCLVKTSHTRRMSSLDSSLMRRVPIKFRP